MVKIMLKHHAKHAQVSLVLDLKYEVSIILHHLFHSARAFMKLKLCRLQNRENDARNPA